MIWNYEDNRIYGSDDDGNVLAEANYSHISKGKIDIERVYVSPDLRGKGVAHETMVKVADYLRNEGLKASATCPYALAWFQKNNKQYADIIATDVED